MFVTDGLDHLQIKEILFKDKIKQEEESKSKEKDSMHILTEGKGRIEDYRRSKKPSNTYKKNLTNTNISQLMLSSHTHSPILNTNDKGGIPHIKKHNTLNSKENYSSNNISSAINNSNLPMINNKKYM